jgi:taurine dioxygenase
LAAKTPFHVQPLSGSVGAEVLGVDLSRSLTAAQVSQLRDAWLDAGVLFFRDQDLTSEQFLALARRFGTVSEYPFLRGLPDYPDIVPVIKLEHERVNFGGIWHSDTAYLTAPPMATMLLAREVPAVGGDTLFASQSAAYDALSSGMQRLLSPLRAVNSSDKADVSLTREDRLRDGARDSRSDRFEATHPVVRTHPETGRRSLYVNIAHTVRFEAMSEEESAPLLSFLFQHQVRPEFTCRFHWAPGSLAIWDNRSVQHNPVNDYHGHRREMHRITLAGEVPA